MHTECTMARGEALTDVCQISLAGWGYVFKDLQTVNLLTSFCQLLSFQEQNFPEILHISFQEP